jgi:hypothetical protein
VPSVVAALRPENGFTPLAQWSFEVVARNGTVSRIEPHVFAVEPGAIDFTDSPIEFTHDALARLVELLEASSEDTSTAARNLLERAEVADPGPDDAALRARLEALAPG